MNFFNRICLSQAGSIQGGGGPVGPAVETLTGNTGGPISPTLNNINIVADSVVYAGINNAGPTGYLINGSASTLALQPALYTVVIPANSVTPIFTITPSSGRCITISVEMAGRSNGDTAENYACAGYFIGAGFNNGSGTIIMPTLDSNITSTNIFGVPIFNLSWDFLVSGGNLVLNINNTNPSANYTISAFIRYTIQDL